MSLLKHSLSVGLLTTLAAMTIPVSSAQAQVNIVRVNGGGSAPATTGSGNLTAIFNAACDWWEDALVTSPYTLTLTYQWGPRSGGVLASHSLSSQSGGRETAGSITFDNDGSSNFYLDGTPCNNSEWSTYTQNTGNFGGGSMVDEARFSGASGGASGNTDLFTVALHEIGHALGMSSANTAFQAERGDNDVDVTSPRPFPGSSLALNSSSAHLAISSTLLWPSISSGQRKIPTEADLLANAQISQMTGINFFAVCPSFSGCSRYIPDNSASTGTVNVIPFGTSTPSSLAGTFANNNFGNVGGAVYFDVTPTAASHLYLHGLDINTGVGAGTEIFLDVYRRTGTHAGSTGSMAGWDAWTAGKGVAAAVGSPSRVDFNSGIYLASGTTYGIAVVARNFEHRYTTGANTFSNADLTWDLGSATNVPFTGPAFSPRTANMNLIYQRDSASWHNQIFRLSSARGTWGPQATSLAWLLRRRSPGGTTTAS